MSPREIVTRRLYWDDPRQWEFEAEVVDVREHRGLTWVALDATAFYPEAGGQMPDFGTLGEATVTDVQVGEDGRIGHALVGAVPGVGARVVGAVDAGRRVEHMALHTGQHALSAALAALGGATISSRLGESATLDIQDVAEERIDQAEEQVNALIDEARPVRVLFPSDDELSSLSLRRTPKVESAVRVIEIEGFDQTPCGGTHCANTSEIGLLRVVSRARHKGGWRLTFSAGRRARRELFAEAAIVRELAGKYTCGPPDVPASIAKTERELVETRESLGLARSGWAEALADSLVEQASPVVVVRDGLDRATLAKVAERVATGSRWVVFGTRQDDATHVVVMAGPSAELDCRAFFAKLAESGGGRGGGRPNRAEGRFPADVDLQALVDAAL